MQWALSGARGTAESAVQHFESAAETGVKGLGKHPGTDPAKHLHRCLTLCANSATDFSETIRVPRAKRMLPALLDRDLKPR